MSTEQEALETEFEIEVMLVGSNSWYRTYITPKTFLQLMKTGTLADGMAVHIVRLFHVVSDDKKIYAAYSFGNMKAGLAPWKLDIE